MFASKNAIMLPVFGHAAILLVTSWYFRRRFLTGNTVFSVVIFGLRMLLSYSSLRAILGGVFDGKHYFVGCYFHVLTNLTSEM